VLILFALVRIKRKPSGYQPVVSTHLDIEEYKRRINAKYNIAMETETVDLSCRFAV
jgi:hypothetical protein